MPDVAQIDAYDIAQALSNQCRFGGHCRTFYSVAQHSCLLADVVREEDASPVTALWALLHDASEAYLVDLPHPLKHRSELGTLYRAAEKGLQDAICEAFGLPAGPPALIKPLDRALLAAERRDVATVAWHWPELDGVEPLDISIEPWSPAESRVNFERRLQELHGP